MSGCFRTVLGRCPAKCLIIKAHNGSMKCRSARTVCTLSAAEVEVKLRLPDKSAHSKVATALEQHLRKTHQQENTFFDGSNAELSKQHVILRCRFFNKDEKAVFTVKGKQILIDGIGRCSEVEEETDPVAARKLLEQPDAMLDLPSDMLRSVFREHGVKSLVCLGGFLNNRNEYEWEGHKLELDETKFPWGTLYEIEIESEDPESIKHKLEAFLDSLEVSHKHSESSKFANFVNRSLK